MPEPEQGFELHPQLKADTCRVARLQLCELLRMNETTFPWLILVPRRPGIREMHELEIADQRRLWAEVSGCSQRLQAFAKADKMNIAALGNIVPQLHIHIVARFTGDPAWPAPIWGRIEPSPFASSDLVSECSQLASAFADL